MYCTVRRESKGIFPLSFSPWRARLPAISINPLEHLFKIELGKGDEEDNVNCEGVEWGVTGVAVTAFTAYAEESLQGGGGV